MISTKAKISSFGAGIIIMNKKRRQKASLGQKLLIKSLNNNSIFSLSKNVQLIEGDSIIKNEEIKITYNQDNSPIILEVEDSRINISLYSSSVIKMIGIGKNLNKIEIELKEGNIITKYKNKDYNFVINESPDISPVSITLKYNNSEENTTLLYSNINLTNNNLLNTNLIDTKNINSIIIPYKSLTGDLWNYF